MGHMEKAPGLGACAGDRACIGAREWASCSWVGLVFAPVLRNRRVKWWEAAPPKGVRPRPLLSFMLIPAVSYSPTPFRVQYHQRCGS